MPSGTKKRKAIKKKKEKGTNTNPSTNNPQGNNELKSQDEKGSDGGECGSPAYHDHDDHHPFNEVNEEVEESGPSAVQVQPSDADAKSVEELPADIKIDEAVGGKQDGDGVVMIEQDLESEESCESKNVSVVHIEPVKGSYYGNGNTSSLNDEIVTENSKDDPCNSVKETVTFDELVKSIDSSHAKMTLITENAPVGETGNSIVESPVDPVEAVASISEVKSSDTGNALLENSVASQVRPIDLAMKKNEDRVYPFSDGAEHVKNSDTPECSENQPLLTSAPRVVQKTSWLNCCGLFEVLSGSNR